MFYFYFLTGTSGNADYLRINILMVNFIIISYCGKDGKVDFYISCALCPITVIGHNGKSVKCS